MNRRPIFLTFADYYLPGYKAGGPIRAISNIVNAFSDVFQFDIVTRDRDLGDEQSYPGVAPDSWKSLDNARVLYLSQQRLSAVGLLELIRRHSFDVIYLNSFFSTIAVRILVLRRMGFLGSAPVILAPRGEFASSALRFKRLRKRIYLEFARMMRLTEGVTWQASSQHEVADIQNVWALGAGESPTVVLTPEMLSGKGFQSTPHIKAKVAGRLDAAIVLRISDNKNLDGALKLLAGVGGEMALSIYGPVESPSYWAECERLIEKLPGNLKVSYHGPVAHEKVREILSEKDLFFFPSLGENFGHAIIEALEAGCPVLVSDRTPWRKLKEHGVGWDVPLERPDEFRSVLEQMIAMGPDEHAQMSANAIKYVSSVARNPEILESNRRLFSTVAGSV
ncbi:MAG: glycosyltransferase [Gemmatimonadaceae bacterium]|nr:glycosyltransferase [Gemmatimonadaceae bacterium]